MICAVGFEKVFDENVSLFLEAGVFLPAGSGGIFARCTGRIVEKGFHMLY